MIGDPYDFNPGAPGSIDAFFAENVGSARRFEMKSAFTQGVVAEVGVKNGGITLRKAQWTNLP